MNVIPDVPEEAAASSHELNPGDTCILYYHGNDWQGVRSRQQYLMEAMSRYLPVYYLDQGRDAAGKVIWRAISKRVTVIRGLIRLFEFFDRTGWGWVKAGYARWALRSIRRKYRHIIFWTAENSLRPYRFISHDYLVFDSMDPCFTRSDEAISAHHQRDEEVLQAADVVFASADTLAQRCRESHPNVHLLNNACEPAEYTEKLVAEAPRPAWWPDTDKPIGAYLGTLDWRVDAATLFAACRENPAVHFVLAGLIVPDTEPELKPLRALANVTIPGCISVEDGRYLLAHGVFGLIPFLMGPINDAVNPVKMYAYALLGKPMLGTAIQELLARPHVVQTAPDAAAFGGMVPDVVRLANDPIHGESLREFARANTWEIRARTAWEVLRRSPADTREQPGEPAFHLRRRGRSSEESPATARPGHEPPVPPASQGSLRG